MNTEFVVVDVETSGFNPADDRILSVAALVLAADGTIQQSFHSLLNPGVDPGPINIHGLTAAALAGQPRYTDIVERLNPLLHGRTLVAHNAAFDYGFLDAEAARARAELPVASVLCTLELAARLHLNIDSLRLAALARYWNIPQARPHDALDDARVLARILACAQVRARDLAVPLPIRMQRPTAPHVNTGGDPSAMRFSRGVARRRYRLPNMKTIGRSFLCVSGADTWPRPSPLRSSPAGPPSVPATTRR